MPRARRPIATAVRIVSDHGGDQHHNICENVEETILLHEWEEAEPCAIQCFHERSGAHRPATTARLLWNDKALLVRFDVSDRREQLVARFTEPNSPTYRDSCVELFIGSSKCELAYMNIEINCLGAILLQTHMHPRGGDSVDPSLWDHQIQRVATVNRNELSEADAPAPFAWSVIVRVPFALVDELLERPAAAAQGRAVPAGKPIHVDRSGWRLGLFKCADDAPQPHWGAWAPIGERLDFHQPDKFGKLHLASGRRLRSSKKRGRPS
jgi:hypothetical protein